MTHILLLAIGYSTAAIVVLIFLAFAIVVVAMHTGERIHLEHDFVDPGTPNAPPVSYKYQVALGHWLPWLTPWREYAITIEDTIFVRGRRLWPQLHGHEFRHIVQWAIYKLLTVWYSVRDILTLGYLKSHLEGDAVHYSAVAYQEFDDINPDNETGEPIR